MTRRCPTCEQNRAEFRSLKLVLASISEQRAISQRRATEAEAERDRLAEALRRIDAITQPPIAGTYDWRTARSRIHRLVSAALAGGDR